MQIAAKMLEDRAEVSSSSNPLDALDAALIWLSALAFIAAGLVLTYSIVARHLMLWPTDWTDEAAVFLLVGATFLSAPYVQARRGHLGIEAVRGFLPQRWERVRLVIVDLLCLAFTATFAYLCLQLFIESVVSGEVTDTRWAPPLWFPYSLLAAGMALLTLRLFAQTVSGLTSLKRASTGGDR